MFSFEGWFTTKAVVSAALITFPNLGRYPPPKVLEKDLWRGREPRMWSK